MSTILKISGKTRSVKGSTACRRLRAEGLVPCNVYGHKQEPASIVLEAEPIWDAIRAGSRVVDLEVDGSAEKALIKDIQWDTFSQHLMHVDFLRVDPDERVEVDIPLVLRGTAPGVLAGGVLEIPHHEITVECLAVEIPESIQVRIGSLGMGGAIHVSDLTDVPAGVKVLTPPETVLVHIVQPQAAPEPAEGEAGAEPEVVAAGSEEGSSDEA